jgi:hypothetical protein
VQVKEITKNPRKIRTRVIWAKDTPETRAWHTGGLQAVLCAATPIRQTLPDAKASIWHEEGFPHPVPQVYQAEVAVQVLLGGQFGK